MSFITSVYLGPYIEVREQRIVLPDTCVAPSICSGVGYCLRCAGSSYEQRSSRDLYRILGGACPILLRTMGSESLGSWVVTRIVPNGGRDPREMFFAEGVALPTDGIDQRAEQHWLDTAFAPEIERIMEAYGPDNVSFHWGLIVHTED